MFVRELMNSPVHTVGPDDSLEFAAHQLWVNDCGVLPVVDRDGRVRAAITDRDICMSAYTRGKQLAEIRVADSMSQTIITCRPDEDVSLAAARMAEHQVRRLPVVDEDGRVCGLLSLSDLTIVGANNQKVGRDVSKVLTAASRRRSDAQQTSPTPIAQASMSSSVGTS